MLLGLRLYHSSRDMTLWPRYLSSWELPLIGIYHFGQAYHSNQGDSLLLRVNFHKGSSLPRLGFFLNILGKRGTLPRLRSSWIYLEKRSTLPRFGTISWSIDIQVSPDFRFSNMCFPHPDGMRYHFLSLGVPHTSMIIPMEYTYDIDGCVMENTLVIITIKTTCAMMSTLGIVSIKRARGENNLEPNLSFLGLRDWLDWSGSADNDEMRQWRRAYPLLPGTLELACPVGSQLRDNFEYTQANCAKKITDKHLRAIHAPASPRSTLVPASPRSKLVPAFPK
ncbi:hypothetical protein DM860_011406 [Cuscuta australis]|uniref:Uncharacterized protein n=1 Tax=Cuscuta australis TaxID=267555 RepID=A0A328DUN7_9ASTE|nr:hypothetical protein DM860_011406 [Cuscuta australis]